VPQQLAFTGFFTPTTLADPAEGLVSIYPGNLNPAITLTGFVGNLHVNEGVPQNIYSLDTRDMKQITADGPSGKGLLSQALWIDHSGARTMTGLPGGMSLSVDGVREYAQFQVKSDPSKQLVLIAAIAIIVGLITSLRVRRRRVWVRARAAADGGAGGSTVEIGGLSRSDAEGFAAELAALTEQLRVATGATMTPPNEPVPPAPTAQPTSEAVSTSTAAPASKTTASSGATSGPKAPKAPTPEAATSDGTATSPAGTTEGGQPAGRSVPTDDSIENTPASQRREP